MANSRTKFDDKAIKKAAAAAVRKMAADLTRELNALSPQYKGKPLSEVKQAVQTAWRRGSGGGSITDPELTRFAEQIAAGGRVTVQMK